MASSGIVAALFTLASCSPSPAVDNEGSAKTDKRSTTGGPIVVQKVEVTRDTDRGPERCHPASVGKLVVGFFTAVNQGEARRVTDFFTRQLGWYSVGEASPEARRRHFVAYEPVELERYFEQRVAANERLYLMEIDVDYERSRNLGHVAYALRRTGDDLHAYGDFADGKGAVDCDTGRITVWSMMHDKRYTTDDPDLCPGRPQPPRVGIACARA